MGPRSRWRLPVTLAVTAALFVGLSLPASATKPRCGGVSIETPPPAMHVGETASITVRFVARWNLERLEINVYDPDNGKSGVALVSGPAKRVFTGVKAGTIK